MGMPIGGAKRAGFGIVFLGSFNPAIFQPRWFAGQGLLPEPEADGAEIRIVHPEIVAFQTDWFRLQVIQTQFILESTQEPYKPLFDLAYGTFSLLIHTPIRAMGLNREAHFRFESEEEWHRFGHRMVPPENWEKLIDSPGMASLTEQGNRPDDHKGFIRVKVEPSTKERPGVWVQVNDHFEILEHDPAEGCAEMLKMLRDNWEISLERGRAIMDGLIKTNKVEP